jgi:hypothetical protein
MNRFTTLSVTALLAAALVGVGCENNKDESAGAGAAMSDVKATYASFGEPVAPDGATTSVQALLGDLSAFEGKPVRVEGTVSKVCERKGCWLTMADGGKELFVKFTCPIDGRLIPTNAVGKRAIAQGELAIKEISEGDARHIAEEGGKSAEEVARIVGPQKQVTLKSPGAVVFGVTK